MATKSAPTIDGNPSELRMTVSLMDSTGDKRAVSLYIDPLASNLDMEAYVNAIQAMSNATVYKVEVALVYASTPAITNATDAVHQSVYDNVVLLAKLNSTTTQNAFVPSPLSAVIDEGDSVDTSSTLYTTWRDATLAILPTGYSAQSVRFTERREKNSSTPA